MDVKKINHWLIYPIIGLGAWTQFVYEALFRAIYPPISLKLLIRQLEFVGNRSFWIICMAGAMVGAVFGWQLGNVFQIFGAESMLGAAAGLALSKELAPVVGSFLVTGRAGSSMAAEIATMRVNEQIDAMHVMAVNPYNYLIAPRVIASVIMMPLLTSFFIMSGVAAAYVVGVLTFKIDQGVFFQQIEWIIRPRDLFEGMQKAAIFGLVFSSLGCYKGFFAKGGAKGVGKATTEAVVYSLVIILISDFFISYLQFKSK